MLLTMFDPTVAPAPKIANKSVRCERIQILQLIKLTGIAQLFTEFLPALFEFVLLLRVVGIA